MYCYKVNVLVLPLLENNPQQPTEYISVKMINDADRVLKGNRNLIAAWQEGSFWLNIFNIKQMMENDTVH